MRRPLTSSLSPAFPQFVAPTLTGISIFCLAKQDSAWVTRVFGSVRFLVRNRSHPMLRSATSLDRLLIRLEQP